MPPLGGSSTDSPPLLPPPIANSDNAGRRRRRKPASVVAATDSRNVRPHIQTDNINVAETEPQNRGPDDPANLAPIADTDAVSTRDTSKSSRHACADDVHSHVNDASASKRTNSPTNQPADNMVGSSSVQRPSPSPSDPSSSRARIAYMRDDDGQTYSVYADVDVDSDPEEVVDTSPTPATDAVTPPAPYEARGVEVCAGSAHLSRCARRVKACVCGSKVAMRTTDFIEKDADDRAFIRTHFRKDNPNVHADFYTRHWKSPTPATILDYALGCPPCRIVAPPGKRRGTDDPDAEITISALAEVAQHYNVRWVAGEQHADITTANNGTVFDAFVSAMQTAGFALVCIHNRGQTVEFFTSAGHAVYRRRIGFLFERVTLDLGPCPPLAISDRPTSCIADHLSPSCDPSLLLDGSFTSRPHSGPVEGRLVVVGVLTLGTPDGPIVLGSRVIFKNKEETRQFVVKRLDGRLAYLFHDDRDHGRSLHDPVDVSLLRAVSFNVDVLHPGGIYGSFTYFGLPPLYGQKQLVMRNGRPSLLSAHEIASIHGDTEASDGMAAAGIPERRAAAGVGKSLVRNLADATVQRLGARIAVSRLVDSGEIQPHSKRPEHDLIRSLSSLDEGGVYVAVVSLHPSTPVIFTDTTKEHLLRVTPRSTDRKSAVAAAETRVACLAAAIGVQPRCFYAGPIERPGIPSISLVVCPTCLPVPFLFDGAAWCTVNQTSITARPLAILAMATTLSMVDLHQGEHTRDLPAIWHRRPWPPCRMAKAPKSLPATWHRRPKASLP